MATFEDLTHATGTPPSSRAAAVPVGRMPELNSATCSWSLWFAKLQFFFMLHCIVAPDKKKAHLSTLCGKQTLMS